MGERRGEVGGSGEATYAKRLRAVMLWRRTWRGMRTHEAEEIVSETKMRRRHTGEPTKATA